MGYNATRFVIKEICGFTLPKDRLLEMTEGQIQYLPDNHVKFTKFPASLEIVGTEHGDRVHVTEIDYSGAGTGNYGDDFEALLRQSTGYLHVVIVFEWGDTVEQWKIKNGKLRKTEIC